MVDLTGKVALVTGSSRGIGEGCAVEMARAGADVVINYHSHPEDAEQVAERVRALGREALVVGADVSEVPWSGLSRVQWVNSAASISPCATRTTANESRSWN